MTRRLITLDLDAKDYKCIRYALNVAQFEAEKQKAKRLAARCGWVLKKIDDAWNAKGREGRGNNTKMRISEMMDDGMPPMLGDGME